VAWCLRLPSNGVRQRRDVTSVDQRRSPAASLRVSHTTGQVLAARSVGTLSFGPDLQDRLVTIEGHLIHRDVIQRHNSLAAVPVLKSQSQWFLAGSPPHFQIPGNPGVTGEYVLLGEEKGFTKTFGDYLPFCPDIGWYPKVRVTGFFEAPQPPLATLPTLRIGLVEYRAPFALAAKAADLMNFANAEIANPSELANRSDSILFAYLAPILFRGSATPPGSAPPALATALKQYPVQWANDMPQALQPFYSAL
jgi:hypothetical protein